MKVIEANSGQKKKKDSEMVCSMSLSSTQDGCGEKLKFLALRTFLKGKQFLYISTMS